MRSILAVAIAVLSLASPVSAASKRSSNPHRGVAARHEQDADLVQRGKDGGGNSGTKYTPVTVSGGGFITGFVAHPKQQDLIYARTDIGGTYKWNKSKWLWEPLTDWVLNNGSNLVGTESIALDPTDPNKLYLAQGQYVWDPMAMFAVSNDAGATFSTYRSPVPMGANDMGRNGGERLAVNPFATSELWFGSRNGGLWHSTDRAETWSNVTSFPDAYANGIGIISVLFDPNVKNTIYVAAAVPGGVFVTKDNGKTWAAIAGQPSTWSSWTNAIVAGSGTAIQSAGPQPQRMLLGMNGKLYVTYTDAPGPWGVLYGEAWAYDTKKSQWADITPTRPNATTTPTPSWDLNAAAPGGWCGIALDPSKPDTVVLTTLDGNAHDSIFLSRDGGSSWKDIGVLSTPSGSSGNSHALWQAKLTNGDYVPWLSFNNESKGLIGFGWWFAALLIDPFNSERLLYGTGAGIWATDTLSRADNDETPSWYLNMEGMEETAVWVLKSPPAGPAHLFSGMYDVGGMRHDDFSKPQPMYNWPTFSSTDGLDYAGASPNVLARVGRNDHSATDSVYGCAEGAYTSDYGDIWKLFATCAPGVVSGAGNGGSIAAAADGKAFAWSPSDGTGPFASSDHGATWAAPTGINGTLTALAADRVQRDTFYAFANGAFFTSTDSGKSYAQGGAGGPAIASSNSGIIVASNTVAGELWLAVKWSGVWHSKDFGKTFTPLVGNGNGLSPALFAIGAPKESNGSPTLWVWGWAPGNSAEGLYMSNDGGSSWSRVNDDKHQYGGPVVIEGDSRVYGRVYFGMNGRGIMSADVA